MKYYKNKIAISLFIMIILTIFFNNTYNIYGQNSSTLTNKDNPKSNSNNAIPNNIHNQSKLEKDNSTKNTKNINLLNQTVRKLSNQVNNNLKNNSGAINAPLGNITKIFQSIGSNTFVGFLAIVAIVMVVPLIVDMIMAYRRNSKLKSDDMSNQPLIGMPGLYRTLMTFGVVLLTGIVLLYLLLLITIYNNNALIDTLKNLATILGTGLATIIAFYFGLRGNDSAIERVARTLTPSGAIGDVSIPTIIKTKPSQFESENDTVPIDADIYAKFSEPMDISSINENTFNIIDSNKNSVKGKISFTENNTKALFKPIKLNHNIVYTATVESEVTDAAGNPMYKDYTWSFKTKEDDTILSLDNSSKSPSDDQSNVDPKSTNIISFKFNNPIDTTTISSTTVKLFENDIAFILPSEPKVDDKDKSKIIMNVNLGYGKTYTVKVGPGVKDTKGNALGKEESWKFKTKENNSSTSVGTESLSLDNSSKSPSDDQSNVDPKSTNIISFKFNNPIDTTTISSTTVMLLEGENPITLPSEPKVDDKDKSKIIMNVNLGYGKTYTVKVGPGVKDTKGNALGKEESWKFKTNNKIIIT